MDSKSDLKSKPVDGGRETADALRTLQDFVRGSSAGANPLPNLPSPVGQALQQTPASRESDQRQEGQLYATVWSGMSSIVAAMVKTVPETTPPSVRRQLEQLAIDLAILADEKQKKKEAFRHTPHFRSLVTLVGERVAEATLQKLEELARGGKGLEANAASLAQLRTELSQALEQRTTTATAKPAQVASAAPHRTTNQHVDSLLQRVQTASSIQQRVEALQAVRQVVSPAQFSEILEACDKRLSRPLVAHIAELSGASVEAQSSVVRSLEGVLNRQEHGRLRDYGRGRLALHLASVTHEARDIDKVISRNEGEVIRAERHIALTLNRPDLLEATGATLRSELLKAVHEKFPGLKKAEWSTCVAELTKRVGRTLDADISIGMRELLGKDLPLGTDLQALKRETALLTLQMQEVQRLQEKATLLISQKSDGSDGEVSKVREHYRAVYGEGITADKGLLDKAELVARYYYDGLIARISSDLTEDRERVSLIKERDRIDFEVARLRVQAELSKEKPDVDRALGVLSRFDLAYADGVDARDEQYHGLAKHLRVAIQSAREYQKSWERFDLNDPSGIPQSQLGIRQEVLRNSAAISCIGTPPRPRDEFNLSGLDKKGSSLADLIDKTPTKPKVDREAELTARRADFETIKAQRNDGISAGWLRQVLDGRLEVRHAVVPDLGAVERLALGNQVPRVLDIGDAAGAMNEAVAAARTAVFAERASGDSKFLSRSHLERIFELGQSSVAVAGRMVDGLQKDFVPERGGLDELRTVLQALPECRGAVSATARDESVEREYRSLLARLSAVDAARAEAFVALRSANLEVSKLLLGGKGGGVAEIWVAVCEISDPARLTNLVDESAAFARLETAERRYEALDAKARRELESSVRLITGRTLGEVVLETPPRGESRKEYLCRAISTPLVESALQERLLDGVVSSSAQERRSRLRSLIETDLRTQKESLDTGVRKASRDAREVAVLRTGARLAAHQGRHADAEDALRRLRVVSQQTIQVAHEVTRLASHNARARIGTGAIFSELRESAIVSAHERVMSGERGLEALTKEVSSYLTSKEPKRDAAFDLIRRHGLSEADMILLNGLYREVVQREKLLHPQCPASGDLAKDLTTSKDSAAAGQGRVTALVKGGQDALAKSDLETLRNAISVNDPTLQLRTIVNLHVSGGLDAVRSAVKESELSADARAYLAALKNNDELQRATLEFKAMVHTGAVTAHSALSFLADKTSEQLAAIRSYYPGFADDIGAKVSELRGTISGLLSSDAAQRAIAWKDTAVQSLSSTALLERVLSLIPEGKERNQVVQEVERHLPDSNTASATTQKVGDRLIRHIASSQRDHGEIDAAVLALTLRPTGEDSAATSRKIAALRALRSEADIQLGMTDSFFQSRLEIHQAAQQRAAEIGKALQAATDEMGRRPFTAGWVEPIIGAHDARWNQQRLLLREQGAGLSDLRASRELQRLGFTFMAEDIVREIRRGISVETTENTMALAVKRDLSVAWKVTDEKADHAWQVAVAHHTRELARVDWWCETGNLVLKVGAVSAVSFFGSPLAGLAVATAWNVTDKSYRVAFNGVELKSAVRSGVIEGGFDVVFFFAAAMKLARAELTFPRAPATTVTRGSFVKFAPKVPGRAPGNPRGPFPIGPVDAPLGSGPFGELYHAARNTPDALREGWLWVQAVVKEVRLPHGAVVMGPQTPQEPSAPVATGPAKPRKEVEKEGRATESRAPSTTVVASPEKESPVAPKEEPKTQPAAVDHKPAKDVPPAVVLPTPAESRVPVELPAIIAEARALGELRSNAQILRVVSELELVIQQAKVDRQAVDTLLIELNAELRKPEQQLATPVVRSEPVRPHVSPTERTSEPVTVPEYAVWQSLGKALDDLFRRLNPWLNLRGSQSEGPPSVPRTPPNPPPVYPPKDQDPPKDGPPTAPASLGPQAVAGQDSNGNSYTREVEALNAALKADYEEAKLPAESKSLQHRAGQLEQAQVDRNEIQLSIAEAARSRAESTAERDAVDTAVDIALKKQGVQQLSLAERDKHQRHNDRANVRKSQELSTESERRVAVIPTLASAANANEKTQKLGSLLEASAAAISSQNGLARASSALTLREDAQNQSSRSRMGSKGALTASPTGEGVAQARPSADRETRHEPIKLRQQLPSASQLPRMAGRGADVLQPPSGERVLPESARSTTSSRAIRQRVPGEISKISSYQPLLEYETAPTRIANAQKWVVPPPSVPVRMASPELLKAPELISSKGPTTDAERERGGVSLGHTVPRPISQPQAVPREVLDTLSDILRSPGTLTPMSRPPEALLASSESPRGRPVKNPTPFPRNVPRETLEALSEALGNSDGAPTVPERPRAPKRDAGRKGLDGSPVFSERVLEELMEGSESPAAQGPYTRRPNQAPRSVPPKILNADGEATKPTQGLLKSIFELLPPRKSNSNSGEATGTEQIPLKNRLPRFLMPLMAEEPNGGTGSSAGDPATQARQARERHRLKSARDARKVRLFIMEQLLTREFSRAKREQLLRLLATLGLTRAQYVAFSHRLAARDAARAALRRRGLQPLRTDEEAPREEGIAVPDNEPNSSRPSGVTRATLYVEAFRKLSA